MADVQENSSSSLSSSPSSSSSASSTLSVAEEGTEDHTTPEPGEEFFHEEEEEGEDEDEEDEDEDEDEEEEARLNSAAVSAENPFQASSCPRMVYSRQEEIRIILWALRGEPDENQHKQCTRCQAMGHVCLDCQCQFATNLGQGYAPQQNPMQPNAADFPGQGQATNPSKAGCSSSSSQEVDPQTVVPSVSSASASQLGKRKSESGSETGSPTRKL